MNLSLMNPGPRIARAVREFEQRRTHHSREWIANFMNEETIVIALHGSLSEQEITIASDSAVRAEFSESQRRLFADVILLQTIDRCCGMMVIDTSVETESTNGGILLLFTTNTAGQDFPLSADRPAIARTLQRKLLERSEGDYRRPKTTGYSIRV